MTYILNIDGFYYFHRRVPVFLKSFDPRRSIRYALHTDSRKEAEKLAIVHNETLEDYWRYLVREKRQYCDESFKAATLQSRLAGFVGQGEGSQLPGISGLAVKTSPTIQEGLTRYWRFAKDKTLNKSPNQMRKWKNPRKLAVSNLVQIIGDKAMHEVSRDDMIKFRDWWIDRIQEEDGYAPNSANKNFFALKNIFETVSDNLGLGLKTDFLFQKLKLEEDWETKRRSFETDYIRNILLNPENLAGLNDQARAALYAIAETGAGPAEQVGLEPQNIHLDADIPYIEIVPGKNKALKTRYRKRTIPLVGFALDAFRAFPRGFDQYRDRPDQLSTTLGKFLRDNKLLPSENHTTYSLRHSFQDRLLSAKALDRVQADLMGHKFNRQPYGKGATLEDKLEVMQKIQLKTG